MPNWLSYRGEGCSLSFHLPPLFRGLVVWVFCTLEEDVHNYYFVNSHIIIIKNKSNGRILFQDERSVQADVWVRYVSIIEMGLVDYYVDDELELYIYSERTGDVLPHVKECGVHVIAKKSDSFEESEVGRDTMMPSPPPYHLLPHPHCGSITASTPLQWSDYLFSKLQKHNLSLSIYGKKTYFL
jgi:leucine-rich repeat protein SHOC2